MLNIIYKKSFERNYIFLQIGLFIFFTGLYIFLDFEGNTNYFVMVDSFGLGVTLIHILVNIIIGFLSMIMVSYSIINYQFTKKDVPGSNAIPLISFIFGILTFGCTSCVVAFLASVGIAFTPVLLPNGNLLFKFAALLIVLLGFFWVLYKLEHTTCEVK